MTPPFICGTTEKVPSFWMLACTRSLMNLASCSSMTSSAHIIFSSEARPIFDLGVLRTFRRQDGEDRGHRPQALLADRRHQRRLVHGNAGHVVVLRGVFLHRAATGVLDHLADQQLAGAAALAGPRAVHHGGDGLASAADRVA